MPTQLEQESPSDAAAHVASPRMVGGATSGAPEHAASSSTIVVARRLLLSSMRRQPGQDSPNGAPEHAASRRTVSFDPTERTQRRERREALRALWRHTIEARVEEVYPQQAPARWPGFYIATHDPRRAPARPPPPAHPPPWFSPQRWQPPPPREPPPDPWQLLDPARSPWQPLEALQPPWMGHLTPVQYQRRMAELLLRLHEEVMTSSSEDESADPE